mmetsp:Transcript_22293/g.40671  ORF Transcript_22293/g.40671 Transcript_22293/m.40671 type:complete len:217 (-) Transcript_22293:289-939(-)
MGCPAVTTLAGETPLARDCPAAVGDTPLDQKCGAPPGSPLADTMRSCVAGLLGVATDAEWPMSTCEGRLPVTGALMVPPCTMGERGEGPAALRGERRLAVESLPRKEPSSVLFPASRAWCRFGEYSTPGAPLAVLSRRETGCAGRLRSCRAGTTPGLPEGAVASTIRGAVLEFIDLDNGSTSSRAEPTFACSRAAALLALCSTRDDSLELPPPGLT